jgi:hypothetical protein
MTHHDGCGLQQVLHLNQGQVGLVADALHHFGVVHGVVDLQQVPAAGEVVLGSTSPGGLL